MDDLQRAIKKLKGEGGMYVFLFFRHIHLLLLLFPYSFVYYFPVGLLYLRLPLLFRSSSF